MSIVRLVGVVLGLAVLLTAQTPAPRTASDPDIALVDLDSLLLPLTAQELSLEAGAWQKHVQVTSQGIADREVAARATQDDAERDRLRTEIGALGTQKTARLDRLERVIDDLDRKGASQDEVEPYRRYAAAVSGLKLDVSDYSAVWAGIVNWIESPEGGFRVAKNVLFFVLTLLAFGLLSRVAGRLVKGALTRFRGTSEMLQDFLVHSTRKLVFFIGIVLALSMLEIDIGPFVAAIGAAGLVLGFALQGTLSNFASGIMILLYRPYNLGDYVTVAGVSGTVEAMTLVSTAVKSPDNQTIIVPNGSIWGGIITNVTGKSMRRVDLKFGVSYTDDLAKAEQILARILAEHPLVLKDPAPVVKVHELGDSSVNFVVRPWTKTSDYWAVYWDITRAVKEQFDAGGVSIPFPQRDVHLHQVAPS